MADRKPVSSSHSSNSNPHSQNQIQDTANPPTTPPRPSDQALLNLFTPPQQAAAAFFLNTPPSEHTGSTILPSIERNDSLAPDPTRIQPTRKHQFIPSAVAPLTDEEMSNTAFVAPRDHKNLRACMVCSLVQTYAKFMSGGCPNCEAFLELTGSGDAIQECTSQVFDGFITVSDTNASWVARYQRLDGYVPGVYAVQVEGVLPEEVLVAIENAGIPYVPRDGSATEAIARD